MSNFLNNKITENDETSSYYFIYTVAFQLAGNHSLFEIFSKCEMLAMFGDQSVPTEY